MTEFLQEYGKIIVAVLVVLALIAIVILFKTPITGMFSSLFSSFFSSVNTNAGLSIPEFSPKP